MTTQEREEREITRMVQNREERGITRMT